MNNEYDVIILGGGTAGLFCAYEASSKGLRVALIDHNEKLGIKLSLAGGGMGNMSNHNLGYEHYISQKPKDMQKLLTSLFRKFQAKEILSLLQAFNIPHEEREYGQIFCLKPVKYFIEGLVQACKHVDFYLGESPSKIYYTEENGKSYHLEVNDTLLQAPNLVIATGSTAYPQIKATDYGLRLAKKWGHSVYDFHPVLAPFVLCPMENPSHSLLGLEGISLPVAIQVHKKNTLIEDPCKIRPLLFTHQGISGPATLVASCHWEQGDSLSINFLPTINIIDIMHEITAGKKNLKNLLTAYLPERLAERLIPKELHNTKVAELSKKNRLILSNNIHNYRCTPQKTQGLKKAEAARGGVCISQVNNQMESTLHNGLYFIGEVLDITGLLGGYNIHFALACAKRVAQSL